MTASAHLRRGPWPAVKTETEHGMLLTPYDPAFQQAMNA